MIDIITLYWKYISAIPFIPGLIWLYKRNNSFAIISNDFILKLSPNNKRERIITDEDIDNHPILSKMQSLKSITGIDTSTHKTSINQNDIDSFFNKINSFDYRFMFFKKHYQTIVSNLNRYNNAESVDKNFDLIMIQRILDDSKLKFIDILSYKIVEKYKIIKFRYKEYQKYS